MEPRTTFPCVFFQAPTSHIRALGLMAQQHASEILPIWVTSHEMGSSASTTPPPSAFLVIKLVDCLARCYWPASPFTLNIKCCLRLVHPGLHLETIEVSDWIVETQIAQHARTTKAEKGEKVRRITVHVDKEAEEGTGPQPRVMKEGTNMAHNDLQVRPMKIGVQSIASPTSSTGPTRTVRQRRILVVVGRPLSSGSSSESGSSDSSAKVVAATGHKKVYKKTAKQPRGSQASEKWEDSHGSFIGTKATSTRAEVE